MHARSLWLTALAALGAAAARSAELTELPPATGTGLERGVALLRCVEPGSELFRQSRAAVLDVGAAALADVLLTTSHGLPHSTAAVERHCRVYARGKEYDIEAVWQGGHPSAPEHDWAVVLLEERIKGDLRRWRMADAAESRLEELVDDKAAVRLVLRYAGATQTDCHLERWTAQHLLAHSCVTYPGESGSPLVVGIDHTLLLIGVHIGSQLEWDGAKLNVVSIARPVDSAVIAAVEAAAARAAQHRRGR
jgi:hypothetical protein